MHEAATSTDDRSKIWGTRLTLAAYVGLLVCIPLLDEGIPQPPAQNEFDVRDLGALGMALAGMVATVVLHFARHVPTGLLSVIALVPWQAERARGPLVGALVLGLGLTTGLLVFEAWPPLHLPAWPAWSCAVAASALGTWMGANWIRGWHARAQHLKTLVGLFALGCVALAATGVFVVRRALETVPGSITTGRLTSDDKRRLSSLLRNKNPRLLPAGQTVSVSLAQQDVQALLAWGLSVLPGEKRLPVEARVQLGAGGTTVESTVQLPYGLMGRSFLNSRLTADVAVDDGLITMRADSVRVRLGDLDVPAPLARILAERLLQALRGEPRLQPLLASVRSLRVREGALDMTFGRMELPEGFLQEVFSTDPTVAPLLPSVRAQVAHLIREAPGWPQGDGRFAAAMTAAFGLARARGETGSPVAENRAAILALGILIGSPRLETLVGPVLDDTARNAAPVVGSGILLRGRDDFPKHFWLSAGITTVASERVSDEAGLLKEERDADGGSGFSFTDLLADRAGTLFALAASRDAASARAVQDRLARGFVVDDYFPVAADLPEYLSGSEFQARYGGVGGAGYRTQVDEIERRLAGCAGLR